MYCIINVYVVPFSYMNVAAARYMHNIFHVQASVNYLLVDDFDLSTLKKTTM